MTRNVFKSLIFIVSMFFATVLADDSVVDGGLTELADFSAVFNKLVSLRIEYTQKFMLQLTHELQKSSANVTRTAIENFIVENAKANKAPNFAEAFGTDLSGADFSGVRLKGAIFDGVDLRGANFRDSGLTNTKFHNAKLDGATFNSSFISKTEFRNCDMRMVEFTNTDIDGVQIINSNISMAQFSRIFADHLEFISSTGAFVVMMGAEISRSRFELSKLPYMFFDGNRIDNTVFVNMYMPFFVALGSIVTHSSVYNSYAARPVFHAMGFTDTNINNTVMSYGFMTALEASNFNITNSAVDNTRFSYVNVSYSNWSHSGYRDSVVEHSGFERVNLSFADLSKTEFNDVTCNGCVWRHSMSPSLNCAKVSFEDNWFLDADLSASRIPGIMIRNSEMSDVSMDLADIHTGFVYNLNLTNCSFLGAQLSGGKFKKMTVDGGMWLYANMSDSWLAYSKLTGYPVTAGSDMSRVLLYKSYVENVELDEVEVANMSFIETKLANVLFDPERLAGLLFFDIKADNRTRNSLTGAVLTKKMLENEVKNGVSYKGVTLIDVDLSDVNLSGIDLSNAFLFNVDLSRSDISGADLTNTVLHNVNLTDTKR